MAPSVPKRPTVLVVDDEDPIRRLFDRALTEAGYDVLEARDGFEAIAVARREQPDVVVLDGDLPVVDGFEVCRSLRADPDTWTTPIIFLTGMGAPAYRDEAFAAGADLFVTKPTLPKELVAVVRSLTAGPPTAA